MELLIRRKRRGNHTHAHTHNTHTQHNTTHAAQTDTNHRHKWTQTEIFKGEVKADKICIQMSHSWIRRTRFFSHLPDFWLISPKAPEFPFLAAILNTERGFKKTESAVPLLRHGCVTSHIARVLTLLLNSFSGSFSDLWVGSKQPSCYFF